MAIDFIDELYDKAKIVYEIKTTLEYIRKEQTHLLQLHWDEIAERVSLFYKDIKSMDETLAMRIWKQLSEFGSLASSGDFNEAGDRLEQVIPLLYDAMKLYGQIDVTEDKYQFISTESGFLNVRDIESGKNYHSSIDPVWASHEKAVSIYNPKIRRFCIMGGGLGYLPWQMYEYSDQSIDIYIYDTNETMIQFGYQFGVLDWIPEESLHIIIESDPNELLNKFADQLDFFDDNSAALYFENYVVSKLSAQGYEIMKKIMIGVQTYRDFGKITEHNFYHNCQCVNKTIEDLKNENEAVSEWIVVGGGPSVDNNLEYLQKMQGKKRIIAATTIYKKLRNAGIIPDYICAMDPQKRTYRHLEGVDNDVTLIIADTASWMFADKYNGQVITVPTRGLYCAEEMYRKQKKKAWLVGGTVSTFCVDIAVYLGAKSIELIGIDFSYPNGKTHANGTMDQKKIECEGLIKVKDVNGGEVYTSNAFQSYIQDMEKRIEVYKNVKFFNLSDCGAYIKGCKKKCFQKEKKLKKD